MTTAAVASRAITLTAEQVRATIAGRKVQHRVVCAYRITGPNPPFSGGSDVGIFDMYDGKKWIGAFDSNGHGNATSNCPFGAVGDRLWVRESFLPCTGLGRHSAALSDATYVCFRDGSQKFKKGDYYHEKTWRETQNWPAAAKWRPSNHLPAWASRLTLELTDVRVERLASITEADAMAEGMILEGDWWYPAGCGRPKGPHAATSAVGAFAVSWDRRNRRHPWATNCWCWVLSWRVEEQP